MSKHLVLFGMCLLPTAPPFFFFFKNRVYLLSTWPNTTSRTDLGCACLVECMVCVLFLLNVCERWEKKLWSSESRHIDFLCYCRCVIMILDFQCTFCTSSEESWNGLPCFLFQKVEKKIFCANNWVTGDYICTFSWCRKVCIDHCWLKFACQ